MGNAHIYVQYIQVTHNPFHPLRSIPNAFSLTGYKQYHILECVLVGCHLEANGLFPICTRRAKRKCIFAPLVKSLVLRTFISS